MTKITKAMLDAEKPGDKDRIVWDDSITGFGVKIFSSGTKSFIFDYRSAEQQKRRVTIGKLSDALTPDQARKRALELYRQTLNGGDPMGEKRALRESITVNDLLNDYLDSEAFASKAESTRKVDKGRIERHIRPLIGKEFAHKVTTEAVKRMHRAIVEGKTAKRIKTTTRGLARVTGGSGTADKAVLLLSVAYKWAVDQKTVKANPAADIKCWKTGTRDTILDNADDYKRMFKALQDLENEKRIRTAAADAIRFIALTGSRRGEVTGLLWRYVDLKNAQVVLPPKAHKTGHKTGKPRIIALPTEAQAIISRQPTGEPDDYVFRSTVPGSPIALNKDWPKVRTRAKLPPTLGLHGLRHSIGTHFAMQGASAVELMELLGHKQVETTLRYIHIAERARQTIAERAASVAMAGLSAKDKNPEAAEAGE